MQNVEFKAELRDIQAARQQCRVLGADHEQTVKQVDTYYKLADGRLKRRQVGGEDAEWIFYHRPDRIPPKLSSYVILTDEQARRRWGTHSLTAWVVVTKTRESWLLGDIRIHLDDVEHLGRYIEFEAAVGKNATIDACDKILGELRKAFGPTLGEPVAVSYCDLIAQLPAEKK
jgi:adenylate cyclase class IV